MKLAASSIEVADEGIGRPEVRATGQDAPSSRTEAARPEETLPDDDDEDCLSRRARVPPTRRGVVLAVSSAGCREGVTSDHQRESAALPLEEEATWAGGPCGLEMARVFLNPMRLSA